MDRKQRNEPGAVLLFRHKEGTVTATVYGPKIGFRWTRVDYFRWEMSTQDPTKWEKRPPTREADQIHLERCVKAVRAWFRERNKPVNRS